MKHLYKIVILLWALCHYALAEQSITLAWDASPASENITGYVLAYGILPGTYDQTINIEGAEITQVETLPLAPGVTYFFALQARNAAGLLSPFSTELMYTMPPAVPSAPTGLRVIPVLRSTSLTTWELDGYYVASPLPPGHTLDREFFKFGAPKVLEF